MRTFVECSPNQSKKLYLIDLSSSNRQNFEDSVKVLAVSVSEFYQSIAVQLYQPMRITLLSLLYVYKHTTVSVIRESLSISVRRHGMLLSRLSGRVSENKMTSFQLLLTPIMDRKLSVNMI